MSEKKTIEVVAAVIEDEGKYFIAQRANKGELALKWEFPGGKIEPNELKEDALIREILEEFRTTIRIRQFIKTVEYEYKTFNIILHCYLCEIVSGKMDLLEHVNKAWVDLKELSMYDLAPADVIVLPYVI